MTGLVYALILSCIILVIGLICVFQDEISHKIIVDLGAILLTSWVALIIVTFILLIIGANIQSKDYMEQLPETYNIVALQDSQNVNGRMYYRSGYIDEELYYYTMYNSVNGLANLKLNANMSYMIETNSETPRVEIYKKTTRNAFFNWFLGKQTKDSYYKIYVPVGTVTQEFNVDLK